MNMRDNIRQIFPELAVHMDAQERREAEQCDAIRKDCANAIEAIAGAIRSPRISRIDLEAAQLYVAKALAVANMLDPKEAA